MSSTTVADRGAGPRVFVDSNILVYCADAHDPQRQELCRRQLQRLRSENRAVISTQVLQEFFVNATRKLGITIDAARGLVAEHRGLPTVTVTPDLIEQAIACHQADRISFWDALIVVSAASAGCTALLTEDLNPGQVLRGVRVVSPADPGDV